MTMLSTIQNDPSDFKTLSELQLLIIAEITLAEARIRENRLLAEEQGENSFLSRIRGHQQAIYYWKAIGDGIPFTYCDRFALKHVYYNTHNVNERPDSGFISGSSGFEQELVALHKILSKGIPCVLCDLTNTIRYGDICVLIQDDPIIIEVKSSKTKSRRNTRQRRNLRKLAEFYHTDVSYDFKGQPLVMRVETNSSLISFESELNLCINTAYEHGYAVSSPELGVWYIALTGDIRANLDLAFGKVKVGQKWVFSLNEYKLNRSWAPYLPFTLLIQTEKALYDFILGRLCLIVLLDPVVIEDIVYSMGWSPKIDIESSHPIQASRKTGEHVKVSTAWFYRSVLEASSLKWVIEQGILKIDDVSFKGVEEKKLGSGSRRAYKGS